VSIGSFGFLATLSDKPHPRSSRAQPRDIFKYCRRVASAGFFLAKGRADVIMPVSGKLFGGDDPNGVQLEDSS